MLAKTNHEDLVEDEDSQEEDENELVNGRRKKQVAFMPSIGKSPERVIYDRHPVTSYHMGVTNERMDHLSFLND